MSLVILLLLLGYSTDFVIGAHYPFLQFHLIGENTAISGVQPWFQQHVFDPQECLRLCVRQLSNCTYVQCERTTEWLCKLFYDIADLTSHLVSKMNSKLHQAIHENRDCLYWKNFGYKNDGLYYIDMNRKRKRVFCDMTKNGGGWTVIQRRFNGSESFSRTSYTFFYIHELTKDTEDTLVRLEGTLLFNNIAHHHYTILEGFRIEDEANKFRLHTGQSSGDESIAGFTDDWKSHNEIYFSTKDQDNNYFNLQNNCATTYNAGWWFGGWTCFYIALNGKYHASGQCPYGQGIHSGIFGYADSLVNVSISIKRKHI